MEAEKQQHPARQTGLHGKLCVVSGSARGIGLAIAQRLVDDGAMVACVDISARRLDPAVAALVGRGAQARGYAVDVGQRDKVAAMFTQIELDFGVPVAVLVNNAVWLRFGPLGELGAETCNRMFTVGLQGMIWMLQAAAPQMQRRGGGAVVNICATSALQALPHSIAYAAMKAGVLGLTRAAAVELSPQRIRVNAVVPGMVGTPASLANFDQATLTARNGQIPLGRVGEPEEIASVVAFLAGDDSAYVQGAAIVADGGWTIAAT